MDIPTQELREKCLEQLYGNLIGRRWIEVFKASSSDSRNQQQQATTAPREISSVTASSPTWFDVRPEVCQSEPSTQHDNSGSHSGVLRLRGLPWGSTEYDVIRFFSGKNGRVNLWMFHYQMGAFKWIQKQYFSLLLAGLVVAAKLGLILA